MNYSDTEFLEKFQDVTRDLLSKSLLTIDEICIVMGMSRSQIHRRVKNLTGYSTSIYIRNQKLERARELLSDSNKTIAEIAYACGIPSPQNMSKYFQITYGISPSQYREDLVIENGEHASDLATTPQNNSKKDARKSIAVLAFQNVGDDPSQSFLGAGIAEEILFGLTKVTDLRVAGRSSSFYYKSGAQNVTQIGKELGVEYCLIGSVRTKDEQLRLIVQLIDTSDGFLVWTERYEHPVGNIFHIQDEIAKSIIQKFKITFLHGDKEGVIIHRKTDSVEAYQLYLKGRHEFELREDLDLSIRYFEEAITIDEEFAHAYFGIVYCHIYKCIFKGHPPRASLSIIEEVYEKAIILNKSKAEAKVIKAWMHFYFYHDISGAIDYMDGALVLEPKLMDAYRIKAYFLAFSGKYKAALPLAKRAYELDPLGFNALFSLADIYRRAKKNKKAKSLFKLVLTHYPGNILASDILGICYWHSGAIEKARSYLCLPGQYPKNISLYAIGSYMFEHEHGDSDQLQLFLDYLLDLEGTKWIQPSIIALICFHLNYEEKALNYLEKAKRDLDFGLKHIVSEPYWDNYRNHPKVQEALALVNML